MPEGTTHLTEHKISVSAPASVVFTLIADAANWPRIFPPSVHLEFLSKNGSEESFRIWAMANGEVKSWTSRRHLDSARKAIRFEQERSQPPVASMGGEWLVEPEPGGGCLVRLTHDFKAVGDDPANVAWIRRAIDSNSESELAALAAAAERRDTGTGLELSFSDSVRVDGLAADVYDFIYDAKLWEQRLPHVTRLVLREDVPGIQIFEMDTQAADGGVHTTRSARVCFPVQKIVYKQLQPPALMSVHTGEWVIEPTAGGCVVTAFHKVVIKPGAITRVLGEQATVKDARAFIRKALGHNSTMTMTRAKAHAENLHPDPS